MAAEGGIKAAGESQQAQSWNVEGYTKAAQNFVQGTLKRTGTLYESTKEAVVKRSGSIYEGAKQGINEGLKRSGTLYQNAQEGVSSGLKRSGTVVDGAREGIMRRASVLNQPREDGEPTMLQRTGTFIQQTRQGVIRRTGTWFEGASNYAYSFYDPNAPIKVSIREVAGIDLQRTYHSLCVIDGRAYIFGGEVAPGLLADNAMHVVILPSSGVHEADYKSIQPRPKAAGGPVPEARKGHVAVVVGTAIFVFGGELAPKAKEEAGRVWVFDTFSNKWSYLDPAADSPYPQPRSLHAAAASEEPTPREHSTAYKSQTGQETDSAAEEEGTSDSGADELHGTLFVYGGVATKAATIESETDSSPELLNDVWAFDIATKSWFTLPPPPAPSRGARLALLGPHLFRVNGHDAATGEWSIDHLGVGDLFHVRERGAAFNRVALPNLLSEWSSSALGRANVDAAELAVATAVSGQGGRHYVLVVTAAGNMLAVDVTPPSEGLIRAAGAERPEKEDDAGQQVVRKLYKVLPRFVDAYGETLPVHEAAPGAPASVDLGTAFAYANGSQVEESHLVVWGGKKPEAGPFKRGWMMTLEL